VIDLIPNEWPLEPLSSFLTRSLRRTLHQKHEGQSTLFPDPVPAPISRPSARCLSLQMTDQTVPISSGFSFLAFSSPSPPLTTSPSKTSPSPPLTPTSPSSTTQTTTTTTALPPTLHSLHLLTRNVPSSQSTTRRSRTGSSCRRRPRSKRSVKTSRQQRSLSSARKREDGAARRAYVTRLREKPTD
jgi:hypothetical protein